MLNSDYCYYVFDKIKQKAYMIHVIANHFFTQILFFFTIRVFIYLFACLFFLIFARIYFIIKKFTKKSTVRDPDFFFSHSFKTYCRSECNHLGTSELMKLGIVLRPCNLQFRSQTLELSQLYTYLVRKFYIHFSKE